MYLKDNLQRKSPMCLALKYQSFLMQTILLKRMLCNKIFFYKTLPFWLLKNLIIQHVKNIWLKHLVMHSMSKSCVSIKNNVFTKGFGSFGGEDKIIIRLA